MDTVSRLEALGLTRNEARVYAALLQYKNASVSELVKQVHIQRPNLYAALGRLVRNGFVTASHGRTKLFSANPPDVVFGATLEKTHRLYHEQQAAIKVLQQAYRKRKDNNRPSPFIEVRRAASDEPSVGYWERITQIGKARKELMFVRGRHPRVMTPAKLEAARARVDEAKIAAIKRGVRCRSLILASALDDPTERQHIFKLLEAGEEIRLAARIPAAFLVIDRKIAWFRPAEVDDKSIVYRVNDAFVGEVFARAFESYWNEGKDVSDWLGLHDQASSEGKPVKQQKM